MYESDGQIALLASAIDVRTTGKGIFHRQAKAARQLRLDHRHHPKDLPSNREIRDQIQALANLYEGDKRREKLKEMRLEAPAHDAPHGPFPAAIDRQRADRAHSPGV